MSNFLNVLLVFSIREPLMLFDVKLDHQIADWTVLVQNWNGQNPNQNDQNRSRSWVARNQSGAIMKM